MDKELEAKLLDGTLWEEFCEGLKKAGEVVQGEAVPKDALIQAEGYRYLTRLLRAGLESFMEFGDPLFPQLRTPCHETIKMGADNPDNFYQNTPLNAENDYEIIGERGTVDYLGFSTVDNKYSSGGTMTTTGFLDSRQIDTNEDGTFSIVVSKTEKNGNWLPMTKETNSLNVRQTFQDRSKEVAAQIKVRRLNADNDRPKPLSPEKLQRGLQGALMFTQGASQMFENWVETFDQVNELPPADQAYCQSIGGDPNIYYYHSSWKLADDEALVIEADRIPECQTWNFQLDNWWMESLDYRYHTIHVNKFTAEYLENGGVRVVVAQQDPNCANWIETAGHNQGTMCWRWIGASEYPELKTKVVKFSEI